MKKKHEICKICFSKHERSATNFTKKRDLPKFSKANTRSAKNNTVTLWTPINTGGSAATGGHRPAAAVGGAWICPCGCADDATCAASICVVEVVWLWREFIVSSCHRESLESHQVTSQSVTGWGSPRRDAGAREAVASTC